MTQGSSGPVFHPPAAVLSEDDFRSAIPPQYKGKLTKTVMDSINSGLADPDFFEEFRDNLLSYGNVLQTGKHTLPNYVSAVKFVGLKLRGFTDSAAYHKTFPDKAALFTSRGLANHEIKGIITAYTKSVLVGKLIEQSMVPTWILNQDMFQRALNTQNELMLSAKSEKVRSDAANSILTHLKRPESTKVELDIGMKEDSSIAELRAATKILAAAQKNAVLTGLSDAQDLADSTIVNSTATQVKP